MVDSTPPINKAIEVSDGSEIWIGDITDATFGMPIGEAMLHVHDRQKCAGRVCVIHAPSDHHMRKWPMLWRADRYLMERTCPHGIGHPDPDDMAYHLSRGDESVGVHGCDGCCMVDEAGDKQLH